MKKNLLLLGLFPLLGFGLVAAEASAIASPKASLGAYVNNILASDTQEEHIAAAEELNIQIADESMVLLKNTGNYLRTLRKTFGNKPSRILKKEYIGYGSQF